MNDSNTLNERQVTPVSRLISHLQGRGWEQARSLAPISGLTPRELRATAAASGGRIITGQQGYCLIEEAETEDIEHSANWLISQGNKMIGRGLEIRRRAQQQGAGL